LDAGSRLELGPVDGKNVDGQSGWHWCCSAWARVPLDGWLEEKVLAYTHSSLSPSVCSNGLREGSDVM
jgi:hypothetical protein